jgi:regulation of enolase protein 1 (concanavalin A-like superfamily)
MKRLSFFRIATVFCAGLIVTASLPAHSQNQPEIKGWGRWNDPDGDCSYKVEKEKLTISVPGTAHDLSSEYVRMNAPTVLREMIGDFSLLVKVSGKFAPEGQIVNNHPAYQAAGLVVMLDNRNYVRLERAAILRNNTREPQQILTFDVRINGTAQRAGQATDTRLQDAPLYLLLQRQGDKIMGGISTDGQEWQNLGEKTLTKQEKLRVGITAINLSAVPLDAIFDEFQLQAMESQKTEANNGN